MLTLKCTNAVRTYLGIKDCVLSADGSDNSALGSWYANLIVIDRRKTFLFMNERTLLSFILYGVKRTNSTAATFPDMFVRGLFQLLRQHGVPQLGIERMLNDSIRARFAKTDSRSALGNMNDLAFHYQHHIMAAGGLKYCDLESIISRVNRMPQRNIGWAYSIDVAKGLLATQAT